ncbi:YafY family protein [Corynebacterium sp. TAE3-ERU30]|uniref:helix-turn-helix transcriptional regulator n=1 Tax=Corynebacterium sp. TAE3-ERU30 TaxID=2849496 RepID=UPI001C492C85|nr:WYL domain-containing protein [Corynebacterium sp. TAE3-ERU30]MBV7280866.1 WYL domain-containing protein [Corynebacterium sp. TAE3-ERU30]
MSSSSTRTPSEEALERAINLTFALLNAPAQGRGLSKEWIRAHVSGYQNKSDAAFDKMFQRDRAVLRAVGVPIVSEEDIFNTKRFRLVESRYSLPEMTFTPEEASVLALAGEQGMSGELATFARSGWTKIAAGGAQRGELSPAGEYTSVSDLSTLSTTTFERLVRVCHRRLSITFDYYRHVGADPQPRAMDPWALAPVGGRIYLLGFDLDRAAPRAFRISRIDNIAANGPRTHEPPADTTPAEIITELLSFRQPLVDAHLVLQQSPSFSSELLRAAEETEPGHYSLSGVDFNWLVTTAVGEAPEVLVISPPEAVEAITHRLRGFIATQESLDPDTAKGH